MFHPLLQKEVRIPSEVAALFHINEVTVLDWIKRGTIQAYRIGARWYIAQDEVNRVFAEMTTPFTATK